VTGVVTSLGEFPLRGPAGEPIAWARTLSSHGVAFLPPHRIDPVAASLTAALRAPGGAHIIRVAPVRAGHLAVTVRGPAPSAPDGAFLLAAVRRMLRLDEDLSPFYARAREDPRLAWACDGAGRLVRSASLFEDVVKTVCTTNCAFSATERMVGALVRELGEGEGELRTFPSAARMAEADEAFYRDTVRAGYRGGYLRRLAASVADGTLDLAALEDRHLPDAEVERRLRSLPGVGPYAAAHLMLTALGRYRPLVLDSWTRPTYARLVGRPVGDAAMRRAFARYRQYAGLAFWLFVTRDWLED
jgi:3-methyladenine DNA glycosylase/8-oxoguanine DNA glycosylase